MFGDLTKVSWFYRQCSRRYRRSWSLRVTWPTTPSPSRPVTCCTSWPHWTHSMSIQHTLTTSGDSFCINVCMGFALCGWVSVCVCVCLYLINTITQVTSHSVYVCLSLCVCVCVCVCVCRSVFVWGIECCRGMGAFVFLVEWMWTLSWFTGCLECFWMVVSIYSGPQKMWVQRKKLCVFLSLLFIFFYVTCIVYKQWPVGRATEVVTVALLAVLIGFAGPACDVWHMTTMIYVKFDSTWRL